MTWRGAIAQALVTARESAGLDVVVVADGHRIPLKAIRSDAEVEEVRADGTVVASKTVDWIVQAEDLVVHGDRVRPQRGYQVEQVVGGKTKIFAMMPAGGDECYEPVGPDETAFRIHTKLVKER